jgi:hypothetical protein
MVAGADCFTVQVNLRHTINNLCRAAALAAVQEQAPSLLSHIRTYRHPTSLFVRGIPEGSQPTLSQSSSVQKGDQCGMLVFCLVLQTPLEETQELHPATRVLAYLQGRLKVIRLQHPARPRWNHRPLNAAAQVLHVLLGWSCSHSGARHQYRPGWLLGMCPATWDANNLAPFVERQVDHIC